MKWRREEKKTRKEKSQKTKKPDKTYHLALLNTIL